jgi:cephalosporin-C deacetylase-like acetyl esterase
MALPPEERKLRQAEWNRTAYKERTANPKRRYWLVCVRFSYAELRAFQKACKQKKTKVSTRLRYLALKDARR